ncbi:hypothetical protein SAMN02982985_00514 [Rugamonas rubra]|uniref:Uncharacterized protein n=1 Tax=Rugamonas rubra TaxID=758825 RepID=A0A1I4IE76_9BURK|nr:hypothetical protein SAMN02982985_00514 [Rugamonas rubra]
MTAIVARPMSVKLDPDTRARLEHLAESRRRTKVDPSVKTLCQLI